MRSLFFLLITVTISFCSCSQNKSSSKVINKSPSNEIKAGGSCEGCEAIYESPVPFNQLNEVDTLPDFDEPGPKIEISGIIYNRDGKTPAKDVVLYIYHTDQGGFYSTKGNEKGWAKRHGYIRGWIKSDAKGSYKFYTLVPASYPNSNNPKHIHPTIKEPGISEYWIGEFLFDTDPLLPAKEKTSLNDRCGNGVLKTEMNGGMLKATRNITLGLNIEDYPSK